MPAVFDIKKLNWMNGEYLRKMTAEEFHAVASPYYSDAFDGTGIDTLKVSKLLQKRTEILTEIPSKIDFFATLPDYDIACTSIRR